MNNAVRLKNNPAVIKKYFSSFFVWLFRWSFIIGICFTILYPLLTKLSMSFMQETDLYDSTVKAIPKEFTLTNYMDVSIYTNFFQVLLNTVILCTVVSVLQTLSCTIAGYGFARFKFKGNGILFVLVIILMVVPSQILLTPQYLNFKAFGMVGSFAPFVALGITGVAPRCGLYIFLSRQFFRGVPKEVDEAAAIDGAGAFKTFTNIMIKSAVPIMVTIFLFSFVWQWGENSYTQLFNSNYETIAQTLGNLGYDISADVNASGVSFVSLANRMAYQSILQATITIMSIIPLLIVYVFSQKYFIQSIESTGIVG
ncbi:MAG: carbohydrate ABC transporter permease [Oscillospiraceae bacterium]